MLAGSVLEFNFCMFLLEFLGKYQFSLNSLRKQQGYIFCKILRQGARGNGCWKDKLKLSKKGKKDKEVKRGQEKVEMKVRKSERMIIFDTNFCDNNSYLIVIFLDIQLS